MEAIAPRLTSLVGKLLRYNINHLVLLSSAVFYSKLFLFEKIFRSLMVENNITYHVSAIAGGMWIYSILFLVSVSLIWLPHLPIIRQDTAFVVETDERG